MRRILYTFTASFCVTISTVLGQQVVLQPWVEVYGTVNSQQLGINVVGIVPTANLPYRAAVSTHPNGPSGVTRFFQLNNPTDTSAQLTLPGENALTGDLNNDGYTDVVIGKTLNGYDTVYIYWGTSTWIDLLNPLKIPGENQLDGLRAGCLGDINNDGYSDLILTASGYPNGVYRGKIYIFLGPITSSVVSASVVGDTVLVQLGMRVAVGDINYDGFDDLIVRGNSQFGPQPSFYGYANIYWGVGIDTLNLTLGFQLKTDYRAMPGLACFDVNGDGKDDLLWTTADSNIWVNVHYGRTGFDTIPDLRLRNPGAADFGYVIANAGDMNGDGYTDIAVGCPSASISSGIVLAYGGGPNIDGTFDAAIARGFDGDFGHSVASLGDVTGDGLADLIVGGPHQAFFNDKGYWGIFKGDSTIRVTDVAEGWLLPGQFLLEQSFPNPFNPLTTIGYELKSSARVTISVFDLLGREVNTLVNEEKEPGKYATTFDGGQYASGVYLYRMTATPKHGSSFSQTRKFVLIK